MWAKKKFKNMKNSGLKELWRTANADVVSNDDVKSYDEETTFPTNFSEKKGTCKTQNFYSLLTFLLITIALLIAVSIYCDLSNIKRKKTFITISLQK